MLLRGSYVPIVFIGLLWVSVCVKIYKVLFPFSIMKKGVIRNSEAIFGVLIFGIILIMSFVFAAHVIAPSSFSVDEDVSYLYNISVQNTDTVTTANITQVNITFPSSFSFLADSNGTDAGTHTFTNTTTVLSWDNDGLVMNGTTQYFWFNATASTPGSYNLTIATTNSTGTETTNISVTINDTTVPEVREANISSPLSNSNNSGSIVLNASVIDNVGVQAVFFNVTNSSGVQNATYTATNPSGNLWNATLNTSNFPDGTYNITVYANDSAGNLNNSAVVYGVIFDNTNPTISFSCSPSPIAAGGTITCSCSGTDVTSGVATTSYTLNPSTSNTGTFSTSCTVTDYAENSVSSSISYTVTSSGGGGGYITYRPSEEELNKGYQKVVRKNQKVLFKIGENSHTFKVEDITETTVKISIFSETQEAIFSIGEEKKFDISGNDYYDVSVKLNSIDFTNSYYPKADFTIKTISERISEEVVEEISEEVVEEDEITEKEETEKKNLTWLWIVIGIIIILFLVRVGYKAKIRKFYIDKHNRKK